jgi:hypothetical protein
MPKLNIPRHMQVSDREKRKRENASLVRQTAIQCAHVCADIEGKQERDLGNANSGGAQASAFAILETFKLTAEWEMLSLTVGEHPISVQATGDAWVSRIAAICTVMEIMGEAERVAALTFLQSKYR